MGPDAELVDLKAPDVADDLPAVAPMTPVTPASQEVRFATAMTGGVSLAVWMGGVARELNLLDQASRMREAPADTTGPPPLSDEDSRVRRRYVRLLDLLDQVVRIDVLSGTSAGGLNAVFLGMCHARGLDMGGLRDTWFDAGALDDLLRDPAEKQPPSLMQGDVKFFSAMNSAIATMAAPQSTAEPRDTTVYVTTTLLTGETSRFTDSYGTIVPDVDHLGLFTFRTDALTSTAAGWSEALALAARSSASFPGAFEPSFLPFGATVPGTTTVPLRPDMQQYANITRPHWVADGGLLANRPIAPLLESIFARRSEGREVRRVLLYIVPDPGDPARLEEDPEQDGFDVPLSLGGALLRDLGAALNQSISADLTEIRRHNDRVDSMRDARLRLAEVGAQLVMDGREFPARAAREDFAARQGEAAARPIVDRFMRALSNIDEQDLPASWKRAVSEGRSVEETCRWAVREAISSTWSTAPAEGDYDAFAAFGRSAFDGAVAIVTGIVRAAFGAAPDADRRSELAELSGRLAATFVPIAAPDLDRMIARDLAEARITPPVRPLEDVIAGTAQAYLDLLATGTSRTQMADGSGSATALPPPPGKVLGQAWQALGQLLEEAVPLLRSIVPDAPEPAPSRAAAAAQQPDPPGPDQPAGGDALGDGPQMPSLVAAAGRLRRGDVRERAAQRLRAYLSYLGKDPDRIALRLLNLHIAERSVLPVGSDVEQRVDLVQVSANTRTQLDLARRTAKQKLTGVQMNHFGAFYKRSWRANDWMWGRLDGAGWLVHVLLDPKRVVATVETRHVETGRHEVDGAPAGSGARWFLDRLVEIVEASPPAGTEADILAELAFLDATNLPVPTSLPTTSLWLATAWQMEIVNAELPVVAKEILSTPTRRDTTWAVEVLQMCGHERQAVAAAGLAVAQVSAGRSAKRAVQPLLDSAVAAQPLGPPASRDRTLLSKKLPTCPVPDETLDDERGEPLFARTLTHTIAVTTAAATAIKGLPTTLEPAFATARTATLTGYRAVNVTGPAPKRSIAAGAIIAAIGGLLAVQHSTWLGVTGTVALAVGLYLIALGAWGLRSRVVPILIGLAVLVALVWLCTPSGRETVFGKDDDDPGWLSVTVEPWLRDSWWAPIAVLVGFFAVSGLWALVTRPRHKRTPAAATPAPAPTPETPLAPPPSGAPLAPPSAAPPAAPPAPAPTTPPAP